jgi:hypothetical protein
MVQRDDLEELTIAALEDVRASERTFKYPVKGEGDDKVCSVIARPVYVDLPLEPPHPIRMQYQSSKVSHVTGPSNVISLPGAQGQMDQPLSSILWALLCFKAGGSLQCIMLSTGGGG